MSLAASACATFTVAAVPVTDVDPLSPVTVIASALFVPSFPFE